MRNHKLVLLGLSLCTVLWGACNEESDATTGEGPDAGEPGTTCEPKPLSAFCTPAQDCPSSPDDALASWCSIQPSGAIARDNSCGGRSVFLEAGLGVTQYHFDADDELVGVHTSTDLVRACSDAQNAPSSSEQDYGRVCTLSGASEPACDVSCPLIACRAGATFEASWPFELEQARGLAITACRNDECFTGMLDATAGAPEPGSGIGFTAPEPAVIDRDETGHVQVTFWGETGGGVYLNVEWTPWSHDDLHDGDRYRVTTELAGDTLVLIDREVDYGTNELGSGACHQSCPYVAIDLRDLDESDGGVDDDDAGD